MPPALFLVGLLFLCLQAIIFEKAAMENLSVFDLLVGSFASQGYDPSIRSDEFFGRFSEDDKLRQSIIENLKRIFQVRRGSIGHLPDFGMPDIMQVYLNSGGSMEPICEQIQQTIVKYEPRIEKAVVEKRQFDEKNIRVSMRIAVTVAGRSKTELLFTEFSTTGWTKVSFVKDLR